jgi:hypothetical protein
MITRHLQALTAILERERIEVFDYDLGQRSAIDATDPKLLVAINNDLPESLMLTPPRFAEVNPETPPGVEPPDQALVDYLFRTLVEPPKPITDESGAQPVIRRAHTVLRQRAVKTIVRAAREAGLRRRDLEVEPKVRGRTREWQLDVKIPKAKHFLHHILVLPQLEETYHEAAALARIWQDIRPTHRKASLTAVFYSTNGIPKAALKAGEKMLERDDIEAVYAKELPRHYDELLGQLKIPKS